MKMSMEGDRLMHLGIIRTVLGLLKRRRKKDMNQRVLPEDRIQLRAFVWTLMNLCFPFERGIS